jgi:hypothetical protein
MSTSEWIPTFAMPNVLPHPPRGEAPYETFALDGVLMRR